MFSVNTEEVSPYTESLARAMASSRLSTIWMGSTGPKVSSCITEASGVVLSSSTGAKKYPSVETPS
ncbi:MAG: hypothetical protein LKI24_17195 [Acidipropionibacterium sp.]|nr:hypothetical protein [Acidipropionibacterium sp.]